ncbi:MAG: hypothetical protein ACQES2_04040 [Pseudomonadota bacterium]
MNETLSATTLAWMACGGFFLIGLLTGVWKYTQMARSESGQAHYYVDIAHRTSLMYSFACVVVAHFAAMSVLANWINTLAVAAQVLFFALAVFLYIVHGALGDTSNQLKRPHKLGRGEVPGVVVHAFMWALVAGELGGFVVLLYGAWLGGFTL